MSPTDREGVSGETGVEESRGLARDGRLNLLGAVVSQLCNFGVILVIARSLGEAAVGDYSQAFALRAILLLVCALGMRVALTRYVAISLANRDYAQLHGSVRLGLISTSVAATVAGVALFLVAEPLASGYFDAPGLVLPIRLAAVGLPGIVIMTASLAATQGFRTMRAFAGIGLIFEPGLRLVLTLAAVIAGAGLIGTLVGLVAASTVAAVLAVGALVVYLRPYPSTNRQVPFRSMSSFAGYSWVASMATQALLWSDIIILGGLVSSEEVGVYQVATRVVLLATFAIAPLTASFAPRVADLWERGKRESLAEQYVTVTSWTWRLSLPILAAMVAVPELALRVFGDGFSAGVAASVILSCGVVVESLAAPSAVVLNQIGRNRLNMVVNVLALAFNIAANLVLIPLMGITGAALAWSLSLALPGIARVVVVKRLGTAVYPWSRVHGTSLMAAVVAGVIGALSARAWPGPWQARLLVGVVVIGLVYSLGVARYGLNPAEQSVLSRFGRWVAGRSGLLMKLRSRWRARRLLEPDAELALDSLISPYRYDVLVRADFFRFARSHQSLIETDFSSFLALVKTTSYRVWFEAVAVDSIGVDSSDQEAMEAAFETRVRKSLALLGRFDAGGYDRRFPITVAEIPAQQILDGVRWLESRWVPIDGCHRLALLLLDGRRLLAPDDYRIDPTGRIRTNTAILARTLSLSEAELVGFVSRSAPGSGGGSTTWDQLSRQTMGTRFPTDQLRRWQPNDTNDGRSWEWLTTR